MATTDPLTFSATFPHPMETRNVDTTGTSDIPPGVQKRDSMMLVTREGVEVPILEAGDPGTQPAPKYLTQNTPPSVGGYWDPLQANNPDDGQPETV